MHTFNCNSIRLGERIRLNTIVDHRYKTNHISVNLILPLERQTASVHALLPALLRKGTKSCPDFTEFSKKLAMLYGAHIGYGVSAFGDCQAVSLTIDVIDDSYALAGEPLLQEAANLLAQALLEPPLENGVFRLADIELEKQSLIDLIESEINEKRHYALNRAMSIICQQEPAGISKYGYIEDVKKITPQTATDAYQTLLETAQIEIMFVGCADPAVVTKTFEQALGAIRRQPRAFPIFTIQPHATLKEVTDRMNVTQSKLVLGFRTATPPDDPQLDAIRLMIALYGGTPSSKLFLNVREKMSLCYYCAARPNLSKGIAFVDCGVEHDNIDKAKAEILHQLELIRQGDFTDTELEHAKLGVVNALRSAGDSARAVEGWYLGQLLYGTTDSPDAAAERIAAVSRQQIIDAACLMQLDTVYLLTAEGKE